MRIDEIVSIVESLNNPFPFKKTASNRWKVDGDGLTWTVTAGAVDVQGFQTDKVFRVATSSFIDERGSFDASGMATGTAMLRLCATIMEILQEFKGVDIIAFSPEDKDDKKLKKKERIYAAMGRQAVSVRKAFATSTINLGPLGNVIYVLPVGSTAGSLTSHEIEDLIIEAWNEKTNTDANIIDSERKKK